jgi:Domain of unknown function (DUF4184)
MPATLLSHQALVLPLKLRWPQRLSGLALCIGSMAPDFAFIGPIRDDSVFSHTPAAQLWFTVPLTMALVGLVSGLMLPTLLPYWPNSRSWRWHDLAAIERPRGLRGWTRVAISAWIGGMSHVLLDGITHGNHSGWLVPSLPFLRTIVPQIGGAVPLYDALQVWLTVGFAVASSLMWRLIARQRLLWRWRGRNATVIPRKPRVAGQRLAMLCAIASVEGAVTGFALHHGESVKSVAGGMLFGAIDFVFAALVLSAIYLRLSASRAERSQRRHRARVAACRCHRR